MSIPITVDQNPEGNWLNGLAFSLTYNPDIVSSATFTFANEWLGNTSDSYRFRRAEEGSFKIALTRFGADPVSGSGRIGILEIVIIEDLVGFLPTSPGTGVTVVSINGVEAVDGDYQPIVMNQGSLITRPVNALPTSTNEQAAVTDVLTIVTPNPAHQNILVTSQEYFNHVDLVNLTGRIQPLYDGPDLLTWTGSVDNRPAGLYYLRTRGPKGLSITPVIIN